MIRSWRRSGWEAGNEPTVHGRVVQNERRRLQVRIQQQRTTETFHHCHVTLHRPDAQIHHVASGDERIQNAEDLVVDGVFAHVQLTHSDFPLLQRCHENGPHGIRAGEVQRSQIGGETVGQPAGERGGPFGAERVVGDVERDETLRQDTRSLHRLEQMRDHVLPHLAVSKRQRRQGGEDGNQTVDDLRRERKVAEGERCDSRNAFLEGAGQTAQRLRVTRERSRTFDSVLSPLIDSDRRVMLDVSVVASAEMTTSSPCTPQI